MSRIAIASTDGTSINEHFGRASQFFVYEVNEDGSYKETGIIKKQESKNDDVHDTLYETVKLLTGINVVLAAQIGPKASGALEQNGILSFGISGAIDSALKSYAKRSKFVKNVTHNPVGGCGSSGCDCSGGCR
ncbi:MAG TPA: NifB/NifX family molybdenum-iron cluster-binding protein [Clostridia bacterium]